MKLRKVSGADMVVTTSGPADPLRGGPTDTFKHNLNAMLEEEAGKSVVVDRLKGITESAHQKGNWWLLFYNEQVVSVMVLLKEDCCVCCMLLEFYLKLW